MLTNTETKLNRIEENFIDHWEYLLEFCEDKEDLEDEDRARFRIEMDLFIESVLPTKPTEGWAFWTDYATVYTKSEELAERLADIIDATFADAHTGTVDPEEWIDPAMNDGTIWHYVSMD